MIIYFNDEPIDFDLKQILNELHTNTNICSTIEQLTTLINDLHNCKIILILEGQYLFDIYSQFQSNSKIDSIFIFCQEKNINEQHLPNIYFDYTSLCSSVERRLHIVFKQLSLFKIIDFNHPSQILLWYRLLRDSLLSIETETAKQDLLEYSRLYYENDPIRLKQIDDFERTFTPSDAIRWYTNNYFPFQLITKALRCEDVEVLYHLRYFLIHISEQLTRQQLFESNFYVYCGLIVSADDLDRLKLSVNQYVSTNGFLSTSRSRHVAQMFNANVLFEILLDSEKQIYADITSFSLLPDEQEILFDLGTIFQIADIRTDEHLCIISMIAIDQIESIKNWSIVKQQSNFEHILSFGKYLIQIGQYENSISYLQNILHRTKLYEYERYYVLRELARSFIKIEEYDLARDYAHDAYQIHEYCLHNEIIQSYLLLGEIYCYQHDYKQSMKYYERILNENTIENREEKMKYHINMATIYFSSNNLSDGLEHSHQLIEMLEQSDEIDLMMISNAHSIIGKGYYLANNLDYAIEYCQNSLFIRTEILSSDHPILAKHYVELADIYEENHEYNLAIEYYMKTIDFHEKYSSESDLLENQISLLSNIGRCCFCLQEYDLARMHFENALQIQELLLPDDDIKIDDLHENIALCYWHLTNYDRTIEHYQMSLNLRKKISLNSIDIIQLYKQIGICYEHKNDYERARENYHQALEWQKQMPSSDEQLIADICQLLAMNYEHEKHFESAICYFQLGLNHHHHEKFRIYRSLARLFIEIHEYDSAIEYLEKLLNSSADINLYVQLAFCYTEKKQYDRSVEYYQYAIDLYKNSSCKIDNDLLIHLYEQLAIGFELQEKYSLALETYKQTIEFLEHSHCRCAKMFCKLSELCCLLEQYETAMNYCEKSMELVRNHCPNEYSLAGKINEIKGSIYDCYENDRLAEHSYKQAKDLYCLATNHNDDIRRIEIILQDFHQTSSVVLPKRQIILFIILFSIMFLLFCFFSEFCQDIHIHFVDSILYTRNKQR